MTSPDPDQPSIDQPRDHSFDGIVEYDNDPPLWLTATFFISMAFAVWYLLNYHLSTAEVLGPDKWKRDMAALAELRAAKDTGPLDESAMRAMLDSKERFAMGLEVYTKAQCANCHGGDGTGAATGPNLRDRWWIHGNTMQEIAKVIREGANENKMPAHQGKLSNQDIANVTIWLVALIKQGERPGKAPDPSREKETPITY
jgi:cytochrome c oxidase cbb3-type subunit III